MDPLVVVLGPTGSGKTDLALGISQIFDGELVGCDSVQVYRHFDLGTAKTPPGGRRGIPHHLVDIADPAENFTAGDYARLARQALAEITARGRLPVVAGGTGFYLRALLEGLFPGPQRDEVLRERLAGREQNRPGFLHRLLRRMDAATASRIHPNDAQKLIRAVEVSMLRRQPMSEQFEAGRDRLTGYRVVKIGLAPPRAELNRRLDGRLERMFAGGLVEEVRSILGRGVPRTARPFESLGYKEALAVVDGRMSVEEAVAAAQQATHQYAKRQMTWFRRETEVHWIKGFGEDPEVRENAEQVLKNALVRKHH
ncbi:MAG TPA: tRNA (adenosine(37)-N6)-dimethylallyltransferase MiaA [Bryobacteraceae bacterium]|nr:tRNA (adenosine(37)-N6)-dimethylallyltransferase MiaA [Bryobacteraceae bacterium]